MNLLLRYPLSLLAILIAMMSPAPVHADVAALGRLEPRDGVRRITAPSTPETGFAAVLKQVLVRPGDQVQAGQLLAVVESADMLEAMLEEARAELALTERQLEAVQAEADAVCVLADVKRREAERRAELVERSMSSIEESERANADAEFQDASCVAARATSRAAEGELAVAAARLERRRQALTRTNIRAPVAGTILDVLVWPGEQIDGRGILELGQTSEMYAIAEVYETDVRHISLGQKATITSDALATPLTGEVTLVRPFVRKQDVTGTDPAARKDARIVEVEVRIDDGASVETLTYLQVEVVIETD